MYGFLLILLTALTFEALYFQEMCPTFSGSHNDLGDFSESKLLVIYKYLVVFWSECPTLNYNSGRTL